MERLGKKVVFYAILLGFVYLSVELLAATGYYLQQKRLPSFTEMRTSQTEIAQIQADHREGYGGDGADPNALSPYLGYTFDPNNKPWWAVDIDELGFLNSRSPLTKPAPNEVIVGIFGGSVSHQVSTAGWPALLGELRKIPDFQGKKFVVLRFGVGGYKQPQSVLALAYLISLGAHFDIVLNVDGFNEIALPFIGNTPFGTSPYYPVYWQARLPAGVGSSALEAIGRVEMYEGMRRRYAGFMLESLVRYSVTANVIWFFTDKLLMNWATASRKVMYKKEADGRDFNRSGPQTQLLPPYASYEGFASNWQIASLEMDALSRSMGASYFHALQPNQYVPGSKVLTEEERVQAYDPESQYREHVEKGYPYLQRAGEQLTAEGVHFMDLTGLFEDVPESVYHDKCCHLNNQGAELLGRTIGSRIRQWYSSAATKVE